MADIAAGTLNPNVAKDRLAKDIVSQCCCEEAAEEKEIHSGNAVPSDTEERHVAAGSYKVLDFLVGIVAFKSKGEARRMVQNGGVKAG